MIDPKYKDPKNNKFIIESMSREYIENKINCADCYANPSLKEKKDFEHSENVVYRIERSLDRLNDNDRFIIQNEVILGKRGDWYISYLSPSTYYRHRKSAYYNFLSCL